MKKNVFGVLSVLALSLVLVGCDPDKKNDNGGITGLTITPNELTFADGDSEQRLSVTFTPSGATADVVWTSTDTTVATVNNKGVVTPVYYGEAKIVATAGNYSDTCYVKVKSFLETLTFNNACIWDLDTLAIDGGEIHEIEASDKTKYKAYLAKVTMYVFSEGFYVNNSDALDGSQKGALVEFDAPMYYVTNYLNGGQGGIIFSLGDWGILDGQEENTAHVGLPTAIDSVNYIKNMEGVVTKINASDKTYATELQAAGECFTNSRVVIMEYDTDESGKGGYYSSYIPDAVVLEGLFSTSGRNTTYNNMMALDYSVFTYKALSGGWYGCNVTVNDEETALIWVDKYIHFDDEITATYGELPTSAPKKMEPMYVDVMSIDHPEAFKALNEQINNHKLIKK